MNEQDNNIMKYADLIPESRRVEVNLGHGCGFCRHEADLTATAMPGCYKLHEYDWLAEYPNMGSEEIVEVRFKNTHRGYYANVNNLALEVGDIVAVEASPGHDIGIVSLTGDMVARQMRRVGFNPANGEFRKVYRKARNYDIEKWHEAVGREHEVMIRSRQIAADMKLDMKIGDVEFQGDGIKAIFYYIADERVDFRELIKVFADQFRIRIEMKQIGARQEAGRIGGLGACGRQLCCSSWISSFNSVTTNAARTQDLSLNPQKLAGQCSKLKCCLTYELDCYIDARKEFPRLNGPLQALDADYFHVKNDVLARTMSFSTQQGSMAGLVTLSVGRVREIMRLNAEGKKPEKITSDVVYDTTSDEPTYINVIGEDSITRFDKTKRKKSRSKNRSKAKAEGGNKAEGNNNKAEGGKAEGGKGGSNEAPKSQQPKGEKSKPQAKKEGAKQQPKPQAEGGKQQPKAEGAEGGKPNKTEGGEQQRGKGGRGRNNGGGEGREQRNNEPRGGEKAEGREKVENRENREGREKGESRESRGGNRNGRNNRKGGRPKGEGSEAKPNGGERGGNNGEGRERGEGRGNNGGGQSGEQNPKGERNRQPEREQQ